MIVILKENVPPEKTDTFLQWIRDLGFEPQLFEGDQATIIGVFGDTTTLDTNVIRGVSIVANVKRIREPYKAVNRKTKPSDTVISVGNRSIGEGFFTVIAGPCSVESKSQVVEVAHGVKEAGATFLRGGAYKPRTSPYSFQGLGNEGIAALVEAKRQTGLPLVTEIMNPAHLPYYQEVDILQVGARNMQNYELLKELGAVRKPILLKRGFSATLEELLMSAEYIMAGGNENVIFCERGIRTYETATRNTLDISAIPFLKKHSHLPVMVDPSHAAGNTWMIPALSKAALAAGADGLMIEVHQNPERAWSDGAQSLTPHALADLVEELRPMAELLGKNMSLPAEEASS